MKKSLLVFVVAMALAGLLIGCGSQTQTAPANSTSSTVQTSKAEGYAGASGDSESEIVGVVIDGPPEGYGTPADQVRSPSDRPPLSSFTEQPGDPGFISLERMRSQTHELIQEDFVLGGSSNPWDYIADGINPYYNDILALGPVAIPDLKRELSESPNNGLEEYLFAIAIEEVEGADLTKLVDKNSLPWSGKEFLEVWSGVERDAPQRISEIARSKSLSLEEKKQSLSAYGALAVPYFMELAGDESVNPELREFMREYIDKWALTDEELAAVQE